MVSITTQLSKDDFVRASRTVFSKMKPLRSVFWIFGIIVIFSIVTQLLNSKGSLVEIISIIAPVLLIGGLFFGVMNFVTKKTYNQNSKMSEKTIYEFADDVMSITAETYSAKVNINSLQKVDRTKDFLLIYQLKGGGANPIAMRDINAQQVAELKQIFTNAGVKNNL